MTGVKSVPPDPKVLVAGTTPDYIDWIRHNCPGRAVFITDPQVRRKAREPTPSPPEEILCDLSDYLRAGQLLEQHLKTFHQRLSGITCYDCESMALAAVLARRFELPYPSLEAVGNCRDKYLSKILWQRHHLETPAVKLVRSAAQTARFQEELKRPVVLKPLSGSGSELIFVNHDAPSCRRNFQHIRDGLRQRRHHRLYADFSPDDPDILAEEMINGDEYSCDFLVQNGRAEIIRLTRKIPAAHGPFGTTRGYLLPADLPGGFDAGRLHRTLFSSAAALGLERAVCMLDFIITGKRMVLLELAPRPGGDCLPFLLRHACKLDMLKLLLDFAERQPLQLVRGTNGRPTAGIRVHAREGGTLKSIDASALNDDPRVLEICINRKPGHKITLPPDDYETWLLGHVIFAPDRHSHVEAQCRSIMDKIKIRMEKGSPNG